MAKKTNFIKKFEIGFEELFVLFLILVNLGEYLRITPTDLEWVEQLLAMFVLAVLFCRVSITSVLFGHRNKRIDFFIILSYFLLISKTIVEITRVSLEETRYALAKTTYNYIIANKVSLELFLFYIGTLALITVSIYMACRFCIKKPSLMHIIHEEGPPPSNLFHKTS